MVKKILLQILKGDQRRRRVFRWLTKSNLAIVIVQIHFNEFQSVDLIHKN